MNYNESDYIKQLDTNDILLIKKTYDFVIENCNDNHPLGTGILHNTNHILYGISSNSPLGYDVHGEHVVIGNSHVFDKNNKNFSSLVSLTRTTDKKYKIKSPCGICRELIRYHYPDLYIIVPKSTDVIIIDDNNLNELIKIKAKYLLPYPYVSSKLPDDCKI